MPTLMMIAAVILVLSAAALVQFFFSYCHSILAAYGSVELSQRMRQMLSENAAEMAGDEFKHLLGLVRIANGAAGDQWDLRAVRVYYSVVRMAGSTIAHFAPAVHAWSNREAQRCSYFAAVALDRRISAVAAS